jgi:threonine/homoserine/homoserine lactone efflux protein
VITHLGGFLAVSAVVIVTPGPDTALTIRNSLAGGRRAGMCTGAGVAAGQAIWALAATAGVAALLAVSHPALLVIKIAGAAYLICLGLRSLRAATLPCPARTRPEGRRLGRVRPQTAFGQGVLSNLGNPKMAVFFISLLPQFARPDGSPAAAILALGLVFSAMTFAWLAGYAAIAARVGQLFRTPRAGQVLDGLSGATLTGLGIWMAAEAG